LTIRVDRAIAAGLLAVAASLGSGGARADVDSGVIRLSEPTTPAPADQEVTAPTDPLSDARRGFDVQAFDSRLDGLWFQRKAYLADGRDDGVARQSERIREFVSEEGVRRLEAPAGALLLEARGWMREGSYEKALAALALAESLDPGRPQIQLARAHALWSSGAGIMAASAEWIHAVRATIALAVRDLTAVHESALVAVAAVLGAIALFALFMILRYQTALRHDIEEWLVRMDRETLARAGGWAVVLLPFVIWIGAGWAAVYWIAATFRYMRRAERALAVLLLATAVALVPAYRFAVGLYGLAADPTVRTTIAAANGGYDPDRIVKLRELVDAHPDDPMYRFLLAGLYKNGRYFEEAFDDYKRVLEAAPSTYQARINLGNIYFLIGQYGEAITNYRKALDLRPDSALAYYNMYLAQSDSFKLKEAAESLGKARSLDPAATTRLLTQGSGEAGGPKVVDAVIDFDSIWRATVEGRHLREWLDAGPEERSWASAAGNVANPISAVALLALFACGAIAVVFHGRAPAHRCTRCGRPFCSYCRSGRDAHEYCNQCVHLFVLGDGLAPETKSMKLYEVERFETWDRRVRRIGSALVPGASELLTGRAWIGFSLVLLWLLAWIGGAPGVLAPLERGAGITIHLAGLRAGPLPDVFRLDAALLFAVPLGLFAWIAGNVVLRRPRGA
jgi:tetratricopeptide (TPR) repeat protein